MNWYDFQPGDRVKYVGLTDMLKGRIGTYVESSNVLDSFAVVEFDRDVTGTLEYPIKVRLDDNDDKEAIFLCKDSIILYNGDCTEETEQIYFDNDNLENYLKEICI